MNGKLKEGQEDEAEDEGEDEDEDEEVCVEMDKNDEYKEKNR